MERYLAFEINGGGFDEHNGQAVRAITHQWDDAGRVFAAEESVVVDGAFRFSWPTAYERFNYQPVLFYADVDSDGHCDLAVDHIWGGPTSAWNPRGNEPYVEEIEHDAGLGAHESADQARAYCDSINMC